MCVCVKERLFVLKVQKMVNKEYSQDDTESFLCVSLNSGGGGNFVLSSSLVGYTTILGAVAPMVHHGYGFFYRIRDDR